MRIIMAGLLMIAAVLPAQADTIEHALTNPDRLEADRKRDERSRPDRVLELLGLKAGDKVADIFAGAGYYSEIIGRVVTPGGEVLLHNNKAYVSFVGEALSKRFDGREVVGVRRHDREVDNLDLGENSLDAVIIIMSYHDLYHTTDGWPLINTTEFMGQIVKALKPGGRFLLVT